MQAGILLDIIGEANKLPNNEESVSTNNTNSTLNVNDTFKDWDAVEIAVNTYAKQNGFVAIKYRKELDAIDKSIILHLLWVIRSGFPTIVYTAASNRFIDGIKFFTIFYSNKSVLLRVCINGYFNCIPIFESIVDV